MDDPALVSLYRKLAAASVPNSARILPKSGKESLNVVTTWQQRDLDASERLTTTRTFTIQAKDLGVLAIGEASVLAKFESLAYHNDTRAILRKTTKGEEDTFYLEIWEANGIRTKNINLTESKQHLQVYSGDEFASFEISPDGKRVLYIVEKFHKSESFFKKRTDAEKAQVVYGEQFAYREDWGEGLRGKCEPVICIVDLEKETVTALSGLPSNVSCGQATWTKDNQGIVFVGWDNTPYKLGAIYCNNRKTAIYHYNLENSTCVRISDEAIGVSYPQFNPDGSFLIYRTHKIGGPHRQTEQLVKCDWPLTSAQVVIPIVTKPETAEDFPGFYPDAPIGRCWMSNNQLIATTTWRSHEAVISVDLSTNSIQRLDSTDFTCWALLDVYNDLIVATRESPNSRPQLVIGRFSQADGEKIHWIPLDPDNTSFSIPEITWNVIPMRPIPEFIHSDYTDLDFESILITPTANVSSSPLIILPHGGPHSAYVGFYSLSIHYLVILGYSVLLVNYRGSTGFGENNIRSLLGHIGTFDVQDTHHATLIALDSDAKLSREKVLLMGGSHGGFLVLSLAGQFPDFYKACIARNPVVDVSVMASISDIPDWAYVESGDTFDLKTVPSPQSQALMFNMSPMKNVDKINLPILLTLGKNDVRVPMIQGLSIYKLLKARGKSVQAYIYDDRHSLAKVDVEADCCIHFAKFFLGITAGISKIGEH